MAEKITNWWVDWHSQVIVRGRVAVRFSPIEFAVFRAFYYRNKTRRATRLSREIVEEIYHGAISPADPYAVMRAAIARMNKKLPRLGLQFVSHSCGRKSFYQLRDTRL